jgi:hypothetical protein
VNGENEEAEETTGIKDKFEIKNTEWQKKPSKMLEDKEIIVK